MFAGGTITYAATPMEDGLLRRLLLEKPFDPTQIKQRIGTYGNVLDYVEGHSVIQRLNDAFDGGWCFEILRHKILEQADEVLVLGKLTAGEVVKCQFGSSKITRAKDTGEIISLADDLKAAGTDSLKKCATMLGVGLHLYNGDKSLHERNGETGTPKSDPPQAPGTKGGDGGRPGNGGNGDARITNKQLNYAVNLGRSLGLNSKDLDHESVKMFGFKMAYLTIKDAGAFIDTLKSKSA